MIPQTNLSAKDIPSLLAEIERLKAENAAIREEKNDIELMMSMASDHADRVGADLLDQVDASIKDFEEQVRLISETIPVPIIIAQQSDGQILYANEHSCRTFGLTADEFVRIKAGALYDNPAERYDFVNILKEDMHVCNFQVRLKKSDGMLFWTSLFSQPLQFRNEPCMLTVIYDLTERREAEEKIRKLTEALERAKEREEKFLMFTLADEEYGVHLTDMKEIIGMLPITPVFNTPEFIKGVANLRGRLVPIADLRLAFGIPPADYSERTCIIISDIRGETEQSLIGIIVDSVTQVLGIKGKDIAPPPELGQKTDLRYISGMAKVGESIKILLDMGKMGEKFHRQIESSRTNVPLLPPDFSSKHIPEITISRS